MRLRPFVTPDLPRLERTGPASLLPLALILLLVPGCGETVTEPGPEPTPFEGLVESTQDFPDVFGNVWTTTTSQQTAVTVWFQDPPEAEGFEWEVRTGTCEAPGDPIGSPEDYPLIELDDQGAWEGIVEIGFRDEPTVAMEFDVLPADGGGAVALGCATLEPTATET